MAKYQFDSPYNGSGALTREQFLFHETRIVAKLLVDDGLSDSIYVINVGGYIGESTQSEIDYALKHGKQVEYLEEV